MYHVTTYVFKNHTHLYEVILLNKEGRSEISNIYMIFKHKHFIAYFDKTLYMNERLY